MRSGLRRMRRDGGSRPRRARAAARRGPRAAPPTPSARRRRLDPGVKPVPERRARGSPRAIASARLSALPARKCSPSMPWRTFSAMPPMSLVMIGRPWKKLSWITTGAFSHQVEGTIVQSTSRISAGQVGALVGAHEAQAAAGDAEEVPDRRLELLAAGARGCRRRCRGSRRPRRRSGCG